MQLIDSFGRIHDYLRISLTDHCNLRCTYCMPEEVEFTSQENLMKPDEIMAIAQIFVKEFGINKIRITGGEPLVRKDAGSIIENLSKLPVKLGITTNGILLHRHFGQLKNSGMKSINLSLDTFKPERFFQIARRNDFEVVMDNFRKALDFGFRIKLNMVVMRGVNQDEIIDFVRHSEDPGIHIRFIEFMPFEGNSWAWDKIVPYQEMLETIQASFEIEKLEDNFNSTSKAWRVKGFKGTFSVISSITEHFCAGCNRIRLTADGKLRNCLFSNQEFDLLTAFRKGENISELIQSAILAKKEKLGGLPHFEKEIEVLKNLSDRSMVRIGG